MCVIAEIHVPSPHPIYPTKISILSKPVGFGLYLSITSLLNNRIKENNKLIPTDSSGAKNIINGRYSNPNTNPPIKCANLSCFVHH